MEIVSHASLEEMGYDITIVCTITNNSNAGRGEYTVTDGSSTFFAYTDKVDYEVDDRVYVTVPKGNFGLPKLISGRYLDVGSSYYTYRSPWSQFVDITGDLVPDTSEGNSGSIIANHPTVIHKPLISINDIGEEGAEYTCIGLKAGFKTSFNDLAVSSGHYGLFLYVDYETIIGSSNLRNTRTVRFRLDETDMNGNPYGFDTFHPQEKIFDISGIGTVKNLRVEIFQEPGTFENDADLPIPVMNQDNIFVNDIYLALGYNIDDFNSDKVFLYTPSSKEYQDTDEELTKTMKIRWIHIVDLDKKIIECYNSTAEMAGKGTVHWYKQNLRNSNVDKWAGPGWQEMTLEEDRFQVEITPSLNAPNEKYKVVIETPPFSSLELAAITTDDELAKLKTDLDTKESAFRNAESSFNNVAQTPANYQAKVNAENNYKAAQEAYDAALANYVADLQVYESNVLQFTNLNPPAEIDLLGGLTVKCDEENYKGIYFLYNTNNELVNQNEADVKRLLEAEYKSMVLDPSEDQGIITSISWRFPLVNTMIQEPEADVEYVRSSTCDIAYSEDHQYMYIMRSSGNSDMTIENNANDANLQQIFRIKDYYSQTATNNTIQCVIERRGQTYITDVPLSFGPKGTNGTDYTFILKMEPTRHCLFKGDYSPIEITSQLLNYNNEYVTLLQGTQIQINWYARDDIQKVGFCDADGRLAYYLSSDAEKHIVYNTVTSASGKILADTITIEADGVSDSVHFYVRNLRPNEITMFNSINDNVIPLYTIVGARLVQDATSNGTNLGKVALTTQLAIPCSSGDDYDHIEGDDKIIYDTAGNVDYYYQNPYRLFNMDNEEFTDVTWHSVHDESAYVQFSTEPITEEQWHKFHDLCRIDFYRKDDDAHSPLSYHKLNSYENIIVYVDNKNAPSTGSMIDNDDNNYYPQITEEGGQLIPNSTYLQTISRKIALLARRTINGQPQIVWSQPIFMFQDVYTSAMLNAWDGSLTIDEENSTIMATMLGAGYKDEENRFNGVLMGAVSRAGGDSAAETGLYGYHEGAQSFGLNIDGTAFFGKSGRGRIEFDGNTGVIQSSSFNDVRNTGIQIDLDDGVIDIRGSQITSVVEEEPAENESNARSLDLGQVSNAFDSLIETYVNREFDATVALTQLQELQNEMQASLIENQIETYIDAQQTLERLKTSIESAKIEVIEDEIQEKITNSNLGEDDKATLQAMMEKITAFYQEQNSIHESELNLLETIQNSEDTSAIEAAQEELINLAAELKEKADAVGVELSNQRDEIQDGTLKSSISQANSITIALDDLLDTRDFSSVVDARDTSFTDLVLNTSTYVPTYEQTNSRVKISALSPYFYVQSKLANPLINIADNEYYLQTDDYNFDAAHPENNSGLKLDLMHGNLSAYSGFKLGAYENPKNFIIISTDGEPYIQVHKSRIRNGNEEELDLLKISKTEFFLQSQNWVAADNNGLNGAGLQLDLTNGKLTAYSGFDLRAYEDANNYILLSTAGNPYFQVVSGGKDLMKIGKVSGSAIDFYLQSATWDDSAKTGLKLDLTQGSLKAYSGFTLLAYGRTNNTTDLEKYISLDSSANNYPFQVIGYSGTGDNKVEQHVRANWNGQLEANSGIIGPFTFTDKYLHYNYIGTVQLGGTGDHFKDAGIYIGRYGFSIGTTESGSMSVEGEKDPVPTKLLTWINNKGEASFGSSVHAAGFFGGTHGTHYGSVRGGSITCSSITITGAGKPGETDSDKKPQEITLGGDSSDHKELGALAYENSVSVNFNVSGSKSETIKYKYPKYTQHWMPIYYTPSGEDYTSHSGFWYYTKDSDDGNEGSVSVTTTVSEEVTMTVGPGNSSTETAELVLKDASITIEEGSGSD